MLLKNARIINPKTNFDSKSDIRIENGIITEISENITALGDEEIIDLTGLTVTPGLVDVHCHLREPGYNAKETIKTGIMSAIQGGYTGICPMANTNPVNDNLMTLSYMFAKAKEVAQIGFYPICAVTKELNGQNIVNVSELIDGGAVAFSDDGKPIEDLNLLRCALKYINSLGSFIISHSEDSSLSRGGVINEGEISAKLGLKGISYLAESTAIARELEIVRETKGKYHFAHISTKRSVELIRQAKKEGLNVTCETAPHYFSLTQDDMLPYDARFKMNPPLRTKEDLNAIIEGLKDGTIDIIATDHAPHKVHEKQLPIQNSPMGIVGFETALGLTLTNLVHTNKLTLQEAIKKLTYNPSKIFGIKEQGTIEAGREANLTVISENEIWTVNAEKFISKCRISPFDGMKLKGRAVKTIIKGKIFDCRTE